MEQEDVILNDDELFSILLKLNGRDLLSACSVNKRLKHVCDSNSLLWKIKIEEGFGCGPMDPLPSRFAPWNESGIEILKLIEERQMDIVKGIKEGPLESYKKYYIGLLDGKIKPIIVNLKKVVYEELPPEEWGRRVPAKDIITKASKLYLLTRYDTIKDILSDIMISSSIKEALIVKMIVKYRGTTVTEGFKPGVIARNDGSIVGYLPDSYIANGYRLKYIEEITFFEGPPPRY